MFCFCKNYNKKKLIKKKEENHIDDTIRMLVSRFLDILYLIIINGY